MAFKHHRNTSLVGRAAELLLVDRWIQDGGILTITGSPRVVGKTGLVVVACARHRRLLLLDAGLASQMLERVNNRGGDTTTTRPSSHPLVVSASGRWFRVGESGRVDLGRRRALRLIVERLAEARSAKPNTALSVDTLVGVGWPGERLVAQTGADRLYTALSTLRKMGLRSVLESRDDGYLFDPRQPFERCEDP